MLKTIKFVMHRKGLLVIIGLCICLVLIMAFVFGLYSAGDIKRIVSEQFNRQQLILARQAAREIEYSLNYAIQELVSIRHITQHAMPISRAFLEGIYERVRRRGISSVTIVDTHGKSLISVGEDLPALWSSETYSTGPEDFFPLYLGEKTSQPLVTIFVLKGETTIGSGLPFRYG